MATYADDYVNQKLSSRSLPINPQMLMGLLGGVQGFGSSLITGIGGWFAQQDNQRRLDELLRMQKHLYIKEGIPLQHRYEGAADLYAPGGRLDPDAPGGINEQALSYIQNYGTQARTDINNQFDDVADEIAGDLASRGLSASTVGIAPRIAAERGRSESLQSLDERINALRLSTDAANYIRSGNAVQNNLLLEGAAYDIPASYVANRGNVIQGVVNPYPNEGANLALNQQNGGGLGYLYGPTPSPPDQKVFGIF